MLNYIEKGLEKKMNQKKIEKTIVSFELDNETKIKLLQEADEKELSMSGLIRYIIKGYFKNDNRNRKQKIFE